MKDLIKTIWNILKYANQLFTFFRNAIINCILLVLIIAAIIGFTTKSKLEKAEKDAEPGKYILQISLQGPIVEQKQFSDAMQKLLDDFEDSSQKPIYLQDVLDAVVNAASDPSIQAILLNTGAMQNPALNQLQAIGDALKDFKKSGKRVIAVADAYSQKGYFLASFADTIIMNPMGLVDIHGMSRSGLYFKDALEKLKIDSHIFKVGTYKSAIEPFIRNSMSDADRQQSEIWLDALWQQYNQQVTKNRNLTSGALIRFTENVEELLAKNGGDTAAMAKNLGFVDQLFTRQQIYNYLQKEVGESVLDELPLISVNNYLSRAAITPSYTGSGRGNIAVIVAEGMIMDGKQSYGRIGGDSLAALIKKARECSCTKALVLRINSGGGSAFASELIRQELIAFKNSGKKLVVSMGSMAASGGYWIAAAADQIWATPTTLTGSIGVFGIIPTFDRSLEALGIHGDSIGTTPIAEGVNITMPLNPVVENLIQQNVEQTYRKFLDVVSLGRHMAKADVEKIAEGRVYDGRTAMRLGLVDEMGTLSDAIKAAARLAQIDNPDPRLVTPDRTVKEQVLEMLGSVKTKAMVFLAGDEFSNIFFQLNQNNDLFTMINNPKKVYAYTPPLIDTLAR